jgi:hypothetical protein
MLRCQALWKVSLAGEAPSLRKRRHISLSRKAGSRNAGSGARISPVLQPSTKAIFFGRQPEANLATSEEERWPLHDHPASTRERSHDAMGLVYSQKCSKRQLIRDFHLSSIFPPPPLPGSCRATTPPCARASRYAICLPAPSECGMTVGRDEYMQGRRGLSEAKVLAPCSDCRVESLAKDFVALVLWKIQF